MEKGQKTEPLMPQRAEGAAGTRGRTSQVQRGFQGVAVSSPLPQNRGLRTDHWALARWSHGCPGREWLQGTGSREDGVGWGLENREVRCLFQGILLGKAQRIGW